MPICLFLTVSSAGCVILTRPSVKHSNCHVSQDVSLSHYTGPVPLLDTHVLCTYSVLTVAKFALHARTCTKKLLVVRANINLDGSNDIDVDIAEKKNNFIYCSVNSQRSVR